jgi:hypothetical protein
MGLAERNTVGRLAMNHIGQPITKKRRIFYHCYETGRRTGGQKSTYQHVDTLNAIGYEAYAVHLSADYRLDWFANHTKTISWARAWEMFTPHTDVIVFPEDMGIRIGEYPGRKVIFNKNLYYGYISVGPFAARSPYLDPNVIGAMVVSDHNREHLQFAYPELMVMPVVERIDNSIFAFTPLTGKKRQGAYTSKALPLLTSILHTFRARSKAGKNNGSDFNWVALENRTELEVATILQDSLILLFPSAEEGLGRLPLEALLSGCVVLGWDVSPIDEYLPREMRFRYGDVISIVNAIEWLIQDGLDYTTIQQNVLLGRNAALQYSAEAHRESLCRAWEAFLSKL